MSVTIDSFARHTLRREAIVRLAYAVDTCCSCAADRPRLRGGPAKVAGRMRLLDDLGWPGPTRGTSSRWRPAS